MAGGGTFVIGGCAFAGACGYARTVYDSIISVDALTVELGGNPVLRDLDLTVAPGEIVAVVGLNGSGKSTLLRCLAGLQPVTSGEVRVFGRPPPTTPPSGAVWRCWATSRPGIRASRHASTWS
ncbi:ATP-binding cassette domain-containing protein [Nonomuraea thailandensis]